MDTKYRIVAWDSRYPTSLLWQDGDYYNFEEADQRAWKLARVWALIVLADMPEMVAPGHYRYSTVNVQVRVYP